MPYSETLIRVQRIVYMKKHLSHNRTWKVSLDSYFADFFAAFLTKCILCSKISPVPALPDALNEIIWNKFLCIK